MNKRLMELTRQFPRLPLTVILKNDVEARGIRPSPLLTEIGKWAIPHLCFQSRDHGKFFEAPGEAVPSHLLKPYLFHLSDGTCICIHLADGAPYHIEYEGFGRFYLYREGEPVEEIYFPPRHPVIDQTISDGTPVGALFDTVMDHFVNWVPLRYCWYFSTGEQCKYCSINAEVAHKQRVGVDIKVRYPMSAYKEALRIAKAGLRAGQKKYLEAPIPCGQENCRCLSLLIIAGGLNDYGKEIKMYKDCIRAAREVDQEDDQRMFICIAMQAPKEEDSQEFARLGLHNPRLNLEVWDERLFEWICPGKARHIGRDTWMERLLASVKYYPRGHVISNFVGGVEMAQPHGFKTIDAALKSTLGGFEWLMKQGVVPVWTMWGNSPGSEFQDQPVPPTEYYLTLAEEWHHLMMEYDLYRPTLVSSCFRNMTLQGVLYRMRWYPDGYPPNGDFPVERPLGLREDAAIIESKV